MVCVYEITSTLVMEVVKIWSSTTLYLCRRVSQQRMGTYKFYVGIAMRRKIIK
jgi:hypothetical protein